ncbi:MAG: hypothetical protein WC952_08500 [Desulfobulbaceae bacterium]
MNHFAMLITMLLALFLAGGLAAGAQEELYIITTSDGSQIVVRDYSFKGDIVEYTTAKGATGSMRRQDFVHIANMIGVPQDEAEQQYESPEKQKERLLFIWLASAALLVVAYVLFLVYVTRKRKKAGEADIDLYYGRQEREPLTQGHLSFLYRGLLGRTSPWTVEVRRAYEEDGILFVEGLCTTTGKRKTFRADRVSGRVTDMSSGRQAPLDRFFAETGE